MAATKTDRKLRIDWTHTFADGSQVVRCAIVDGKRIDGYVVTRKLDSCEIEWCHVADVTRTYRLVCSAGSDRPVACDCPANQHGYRGDCRHKLATVKLLEAGHLNNGPTRGDEPEYNCEHAEDADAASRYYETLERGFRPVEIC